MPRRARQQVLDLNAVHVNPCRPWLFAVGGDDPFARVFDLRAMRNLSGSRARLARSEDGAGQTGSSSRLETIQCEPVSLNLRLVTNKALDCRGCE